MKKRVPVVYVGARLPAVRVAISDRLVEAGVRVYTPPDHPDADAETASISTFCCAIFLLDRPDGSGDVIDEAELMRIGQPALPLAFIHQRATERMLRRAEVLGPIFAIPEGLDEAFAWAMDGAARAT